MSAGRVVAPAGRCRVLCLCLWVVFVIAFSGFLTVNFRLVALGVGNKR
jgi:hypothetical protein